METDESNHPGKALIKGSYGAAVPSPWTIISVHLPDRLWSESGVGVRDNEVM